MNWNFQSTDARQALFARGKFTEFLHESCTPDSDFDGAELVFGELVANVVRHAPGPIHIRVQCSLSGAIQLNVCDNGKGFTMKTALPSQYSEGGRGLYLASKFARCLNSYRTEEGTKVTAVLPVIARGSVLHDVSHGRGIRHHQRVVGD